MEQEEPHLDDEEEDEDGRTSPLYSNWDLRGMQHLLPLQDYIIQQAKLSSECFVFTVTFTNNNIKNPRTNKTRDPTRIAFVCNPKYIFIYLWIPLSALWSPFTTEWIKKTIIK